MRRTYWLRRHKKWSAVPFFSCAEGRKGVTLPLSAPANKFAGDPSLPGQLCGQSGPPAKLPVCLPVPVTQRTGRGIDHAAEVRKRDERKAPGKTEHARGDSKSHERHNRIVHCTVTECSIPAACKPSPRAA